MNRPFKHLGPLSLHILLLLPSLVTRSTSSVLQSHFNRRAYETARRLVATACQKPTLSLRWWPHLVLHCQTLTSISILVTTAPKTTRITLEATPRSSRRPSNWPASSNRAIRYDS